MIKTIAWTPDFGESSYGYYDEDDPEGSLHFESINEYIKEHVVNSVTEKIQTLVENNTLFEVYGYDRVKVPRREFGFLPELLERLNEDYGDSESIVDWNTDGTIGGLSSEHRVELEKLESQFMDKLHEYYKPQLHIQSAKIIVPFRYWFESLSERDQAILLDEGDDVQF